MSVRLASVGSGDLAVLVEEESDPVVPQVENDGLHRVRYRFGLEPAVRRSSGRFLPVKADQGRGKSVAFGLPSDRTGLRTSLARNKWSYSHDFHDVKAGNNDVAELDGFGYHADKGWDPVTGLGTPKAANLLPALAHRH
jgi:hypothetical protein